MNGTLRAFSKSLAGIPLLWFMLGGLLFLYLPFFLPGPTPIWLSGDQAVYLVNATRIVQGQVIYRDFCQYTLPGTELVYAGLFRLLGIRSWIPNVLLILLGLSLAWLSVSISRKVLDRRSAFLPGLLFLVVPFRHMLNGTHHWFSALAVMAAVAVVIEKRTLARLAAAGALCGLAAFFTQARGLAAILGLAVFLLWEHWQEKQSGTFLKRELYLLLSFLATQIATNAYFIFKVGLGAFWDCTVTFGLRHYSAHSEANSLKAYMLGLPLVPPWRHLPTLGVWLFIHGLLPLVYLLFFFRYRREVQARPEEPWDRLMLLSIVGLFLFLGVAPAPNWFRLCSISLPELILLVWLVNSMRSFRALLLGCLWIVAGILAVTEPWPARIHWHGYLDLPTGRTAFPTQDSYDKYKWVLQRTRPSEFFFDGASLPRMYFPLGLRNPAKVPFFTTTDYTRPEQVEDALGALERHKVRFVVWALELDMPPLDRPEGDHLGPLRAYLRARYHVVKVFPDFDQVWERNR